MEGLSGLFYIQSIISPKALDVGNQRTQMKLPMDARRTSTETQQQPRTLELLSVQATLQFEYELNTTIDRAYSNMYSSCVCLESVFGRMM